MLRCEGERERGVADHDATGLVATRIERVEILSWRRSPVESDLTGRNVVLVDPFRGANLGQRKGCRGGGVEIDSARRLPGARWLVDVVEAIIVQARAHLQLEGIRHMPVD